MIPILELVRLETSEQWGTFGVLLVQKEVFCVTLELPYKLNRANESNIPIGQYSCRRFNSPKFGETYMVENVPGREWILFHPGNTKGDSKGCIILAEHVGKLRGDRAVLNSGATFKRFLGALHGYEKAHLTVTRRY